MTLFLPLGTTVGITRTVGLLGAGTHSQVYLTIDNVGRLGAVKVLRPNIFTSDAVRRYAKVASAAAELTGGVVQIISEANPTCVRVPLVRGQCLNSLLGGKDRFHWLLAEKLLYSAASQLERVHEAKIVHGSLKPSNVFVCFGPDGLHAVQLVDFGASYLAVGSEVTVADKLLQYLAPEQALTPAGDMYALGAVIFRMLTGSAPPLAVAKSREQIQHALRDVAQEAPGLCKTVCDLLASDPKKRPTATALAEDGRDREDEVTTLLRTRSLPKKRTPKRAQRKNETEPTRVIPNPAPEPKRAVHKTETEPQTTFIQLEPEAHHREPEPTQIVVNPAANESGFTVITSLKSDRSAKPESGSEKRLLLLNVSLVIVVVLILVILAISS